ncbi:MAG: alanine racemase [Bacilli bacterium]|nr:alanine racemase [Bacilli bacterium]
MYRNTYIEVNLNNIENNIKKIIKCCPGYKYYFGVAKANCYGHGLSAIEPMIRGGVNYLAVATLDEALEIRKINNNIPILCLGIIPLDYVSIARDNNIAITISNKDYLESILNFDNLVCHIKINTGMNRLGFNNDEEIKYAYNKLINSNNKLEGIYTHIYNASDNDVSSRQIELFKKLTSLVDLSKIKIIHIGASDYTINYPKLDFVNGCRLGIIMYGLTSNLNLKSTFSLISEVIQINEIKKGETVGYNGTYKALCDSKIAVIPIGYADGMIRENKGRYIYINNNKYEIVGNICMDMLFVKIDDNVHVHDKVYLIKDNYHINYIASYLNTIPYEVICSFKARVPIKYI